MTNEEAKNKIEAEFIGRYYQWLHDIQTMDPEDTSRTSFGWKYGYVLGGDRGVRKITKNGKDTQKNLIWFQSHIYSGRWYQDWLGFGLNGKNLMDLERSGFLSHDHYFSSRARASGREDFYYLSQATAKEVYKRHKQL